MLARVTTTSLLAALAFALGACRSTPAGNSGSDGSAGHDAAAPRKDATVGYTDHHDADIPDVNRGEAPSAMADFCKLPGSVVWSGGLPHVVPGGGTPASANDLSWMVLPDGFCSHFFANVPETRQLRFSPSGDLFVASPSVAATGGASGGAGAVLVLPDDNHDGFADQTDTFVGGIPTTQGLLFSGGYFYYQDGTIIRRLPYKNGDRKATAPGQQVIDVNVLQAADHWSKVLDADDDGNIYVTNGGDNGDPCEGAGASDGEVGTSRPFHGGVLQIDGTPNGKLIARGLRNPIAIRCAKGTGTCFGLELALDFAASEGSREKLFPIHEGDDWGFPCCATANLPYTAYSDPTPDCSGVASEQASFIIDHTPFGLDFEEGYWSGSWKYRAFVVLHGVFGSWVGARVVGIATDPRTGWPVASSEADAGTAITDFATGWDDAQQDHGRPAAITFAPDGRMFVGNDINGMILWIAPVTGS
jgi:glucose/arabinose dehydrogenase